MPPDAYILWTERGLSCRLGRTGEGWQVSVEAHGGSPFLRHFAHSKGDAGNQAEYLRLLLDRSRGVARKSRERRAMILVVEDDPENRFAHEATLKLEGFRVASASSIAGARRLVREVKPSAILLDQVLPDGEGPTFARELRRSSMDESIPIVLVTGRDPASVSPWYDGGPDALLGKPCRPEALTGVIKLLVQRTAARRTAAARPGEAAGPLVRARCPLCGLAGALVETSGGFHCQQCGEEGRMHRTRDVETGF